MDAATTADIDQLAQQIVNGDANNQKFQVAREAAAALLDLMRIRKVRNELLAKTDLARATSEELQHLLAIDRYESRARTRCRRASGKLQSN
jgi:hypothetical protein